MEATSARFAARYGVVTTSPEQSAQVIRASCLARPERRHPGSRQPSRPPFGQGHVRVDGPDGRIGDLCEARAVPARMANMVRRFTKAALSLIPAVVLAACSHPGGDPDGAVLRSLQETTGVIPPGASNVRTQSLTAAWTPPCPEFPEAHAGWSADQVFISFTASPSARVLQHLDSGLRQLGWQRHDTVVTQGQGPVPHWTLITPSGHKADAFAFQAPPRSGRWAVNSSWQPPGPKAEGCP